MTGPTLKGIGRGARSMVRFPGPFSKKAKQRKRARSKELESSTKARSGQPSGQDETGFYSDLEEESPGSTGTPVPEALSVLDSRNSDNFDKVSLATADGMSEVCQPPSSIPSSRVPETLNWDEYTTSRHVNGVTVYQQQEPDSKEATYMVSACVHATPEDCLKAVLAITGGSTSDPSEFQSALIEQIADQTRVLKIKLQPRSWVSALVAPREMVVEQSWRQEENGVYLVMSSSKDHPAVPVAEAPWYHWFSPVRAQVISAGWTLSPLQPEYLEGRPSHQCLVTLVLKLDLGGWLSSGTGTFMAALLGPFMSNPLGASVRNAFLQPLLMSVISLRDKVEQARFMAPPFTLKDAVPSEEEEQHQQPQMQQPRKADPPQQGGTRSLLADLRASRKRSAHQQRSYTIDTKFWRDPGVANFKVRGANYLKDSKKMKSEEPYFELLTTELVATEDRVLNVSRFLPAIRDCKARFVFVLNVIFSKAPRLGLVMAWATSLDPFHPDRPWSQLTPHERCLQEFLEGDLDDASANSKRHNMLKLIPSVPQGSWIIKQSVGSTPVLLGNKISTTYHRGPRWLEADIDMESSTVANHVVALVKGVTTSQTIDMAVVLQGSRPELLPERLLGSVRFCHLDLKTAIPLNPNDYPDDLLEDIPLSPPSAPHSPSAPPPGGPTPDSVMQSSLSAQSLHSLRSASATGSNISAQDMGHLEALRQSSGTNGHVQTQPASDRGKFGSGPVSFPHVGSGSMWSSQPVTSGQMGSGQLSNMGSGGSNTERPWPSQQSHAGTPHQSAGLSTVPEVQPPSEKASQQAYLQSQSMKPQSEARAAGGGHQRSVPADRVKWTEKTMASGHL
ncbi:hypothetical protein ABBQ32_008199 [Trebouxia sp. C0010 RCD-2024]